MTIHRAFRRRCRRTALCLMAGLVSAGVLFAPAASAAVQGYTDRSLSVLTEPTADFSEYLSFYRGGERCDPTALTWAAGHTGQGVLLSGADYLELTNELPLDEGTFSFWINWKGAPDGGTPYDQTLFTFFEEDGERVFLTPWHQDLTVPLTEPSAEGSEQTAEESPLTYADGLYLAMTEPKDGGRATAFEVYQPTMEHVSTCLPQNEWHNLTFSVYAMTLKIYVDGVLWHTAEVDTRIGRIGLDRCRIGADADGANGLYAVLDDVTFYEVTLTDEQVALLTAGMDPLDEASDVSAIPKRELYYPTAPAPTEESGEVSDAPQEGEEDTGFLANIPPLTYGLVGGLLGLAIVLSVIMSFTEPRRQKKKDGQNRQGGDAS